LVSTLTSARLSPELDRLAKVIDEMLLQEIYVHGDIRALAGRTLGELDAARVAQEPTIADSGEHVDESRGGGHDGAVLKRYSGPLDPRQDGEIPENTNTKVLTANLEDAVRHATYRLEERVAILSRSAERPVDEVFGQLGLEAGDISPRDRREDARFRMSEQGLGLSLRCHARPLPATVANTSRFGWPPSGEGNP
jgi:hypothetical protein